MVVEVASKVGQSVSQSLGGIGLAGGSMLLRLRRTSIALLGLVGAVGLGLIIFISQLGWPTVLSGPLPGTPAKVGIQEGVALTQPASVAPGVPAAKGGRVSAATRVRHGKGRAGRSTDGESGLAGSRGLNAATGTQPGTGSGQPVSQPAPQPAPATSSPVASTPVASGTQGSSAAGKAKAANDGARSAELASSQGEGPKTAGVKDPSPVGGSKSGELASVKAQRDESTAVASPSPPAGAAPAANPAAAKEAADAAR
jgi:hypothetical protein